MKKELNKKNRLKREKTKSKSKIIRKYNWIISKENNKTSISIVQTIKASSSSTSTSYTHASISFTNK